MKTPVAIFLYRRAEQVRQVMASLQAERPAVIWLIADGPKGPEEEPLCRAARREAETAITWPCDLRRVYAESNLGLKERIESGLDEVFAREREAVLLEEDCHPTPDFLPFCEAMLSRYRENERVAGIAGNCFLPAEATVSTSYFFSRFLHIWGWATWAKVWRGYERSRWEWPREGIRQYFPRSRPDEIRYWNLIFSRVASGRLQTWDYRWTSHLWSRGLCAVVPSQNLVVNRGFGVGATHTRDKDIQVGIEREQPLRPPYIGPDIVQANATFDRMIFENHFLRSEGKKSLWLKLITRLSRKPAPEGKP